MNTGNTFPFFCYYIGGYLFWFRVFGFGMLCKNYRINPLLFSQRTGKAGVVFLDWYCEFLKP